MRRDLAQDGGYYETGAIENMAGVREESIIQNLKDAGCDSETIACFITDFHGGKKANGMKRLAAHRRKLLDLVHEDQKCIDCLDYLVYQLQKEEKR